MLPLRRHAIVLIIGLMRCQLKHETEPKFDCQKLAIVDGDTIDNNLHR